MSADDLAEHEVALRAVEQSNRAPDCFEWQLENAEAAGLISKSHWPAGAWKLTLSGMAALGVIHQRSMGIEI